MRRELNGLETVWLRDGYLPEWVEEFIRSALFRLDLAQNELFRQFFESTGLSLPAYLLLE